MAKSIFIEGMDGSGKSTQIKLLKEYLEKSGEKVLLLREPGGSDYYEAIREHIHFSEFPRPPLSDALTCAGGIAANVVLAKQALTQNTWVISDRAYPSNLVYQVANGLDEKLAQEANRLALQGFDYDMKILIDVPVAVAQKRLAEIGKKKDRYESLGAAYFEAVRAHYKKLAEVDGYFILDGEASIETTRQKILDYLDIQ